MTGSIGRAHWLPWVAGVLGAFAYAVAFYPGAMSFDSAYQWWQARGGESTNVHGVGMTWLWRMGNAVAPGPGALFALQLVLFWSGLVLISRHLAAPTAWRAAFVLAAASAPVGFLLFSHVWSDVLLIAVLTFATGALLHARGRSVLWYLPVCALLFIAVTLRHNAVAAVLPLLVYMVRVQLRGAGGNRSAGTGLRAAGMALLIALGFMFVTTLIERTVDRPRTLFTATQLWDLTAISFEAGEILLPPPIYGPGMTLADLRQAFAPYANTPLFERTKAGLRRPYFDPDDPLVDAIRRAWLAAIVAHPGAYVAHRWAVTQALFGRKSRDWPSGLVYYDGAFQYGDNPPVAPNASRLHAWCMRLFDAMRDSVLLSAWPYLGVALIALVRAVRRRRQADMAPAIAVLASGLLYAAPLPLIAPSAELRYVGWTCVAALIGAALVLAPSRRSRE